MSASFVSVKISKASLVFFVLAVLLLGFFWWSGLLFPKNEGADPQGGVAYARTRSLPLHQIKMPKGFSISVFSDRVPGARSLVRGAKGTIFVSTRTLGKVYALVDTDQDGRADKVYTLLTRRNMPNGVEFRDGSLYVAEVNRILRLDRIEERLSSPPPPVIVNDSFPRERSHGWKFIRFSPDGKWLYVPVGAPCNLCERLDNPRYASITRMSLDGKKVEVFAHGVRNSVGFDFHPVTKELWFTDNGRDWLGDDLPPCELNHAPRQGMHFGYPYCHGKDIADPKFGSKRKCSEFTPPAQALGAHVAPLGMVFYTGSMFPQEYKHQIFIPEHGSWNRSTPLGYRVTLVRLKDNKVAKSEIFAEGWLQNDRPWGRPVAFLNLSDGSLLLSDDHAGAVYRITYKAP